MKTSGNQSTEINASVTKRPLSFLRKALQSSSSYATLKSRLEQSLVDKDKSSIDISGLQGSLSSLLVAALVEDLQRPVMVICNQDIFDLYDNDFTLLIDPASYHTAADELSAALSTLAEHRNALILADFDDLKIRLQNPDGASDKIFPLQNNSDAGYNKLINFLSRNNFNRRDFVDAEGEFSTRGSIIDIFPFGAREPLRIEFFGDTITSIRSFDTNSQLSKTSVQTVELTGNFLLEPQSDEDRSWSIFDYLPASTIIVIDDAASLSAAENLDDAKKKLAGLQRVQIHRLIQQEIEFGSFPQQQLQANFPLFARELATKTAQDLQTVFIGSSKKEIEELAEFIAEEKVVIESRALVEINWIAANLYSGFRFNGYDVYSESDIFGKLHTHKQHRKKAVKGISLKDLHRLNVGDHIVHEDYGIGIFKALETIQVGNSEQECVLVEYDKGDQLYVNVQNIGLLSKYSAAEGSLPSLSRLGSSKWKAKKDKVKKRLRDIASELIKLYAKRKMTPGFAFGQDSIFQREFEASFIFDETPDQLKAIEEVKKDMQSPFPMDRLICGDAGFGKTEIAMRAAFKAVESSKQVAVLTPTTILAHQHMETFTRRFGNFPVNIAVLSRFVSKSDQKKIVHDLSKGLIDIVIGTHRLVSKDVVFQDLGLLVIDEEQHFGVSVKEKLRQTFPSVDTLTMSATPIPRTLQFSMLGARDLSIVSTPPKNRQPVETMITTFDTDLLQSAIRTEINRKGQVFVLHNRIAGLEEMKQTLQELVPGVRMAYAHGQMPTAELENIMMDFITHELDVLISTSIIGSGLDISNANTIIINRADMFGLSDLYQLRGRVGRSDRRAYSYLITPPIQTLKQDAIQRLAVIESFTELGSGFNIAMRDLDIRGAGNLLGSEQSGAIHELGFNLYQKLLEEAVAELKTGAFSSLFSDNDQSTIREKHHCDISFFFDALIPDYYVSSAQERFMFYEKISKALNNETLKRLEDELQDRFGALPQDVENLLGLARLQALCSSLGLAKVDLQHNSTTLTLPPQDRDGFYNGTFFHTLLASVQDPWMQIYKPRFSQEKRMKLVLQHPETTAGNPEKILDVYTTLLLQLQQIPETQATENSNRKATELQP